MPRRDPIQAIYRESMQIKKKQDSVRCVFDTFFDYATKRQRKQ